MKETNYKNILLKVLGISGFLMPVLCLIFNSAFGGSYNPPGLGSSISASHYSSSYILFEGLIFGMGMLLIIYRGYDRIDRAVSALAGVSAIVVALFPCAMDGAPNRNFLMIPMNVTQIIHFIFALVFFGSLSFIIGFRFTKASKETKVIKKSRKWRRNILYIVCAAAMVAALALGYIGRLIFPASPLFYAGEWVTFWAFGLAYLVKGGLFLKDQKTGDGIQGPAAA